MKIAKRKFGLPALTIGNRLRIVLGMLMLMLVGGASLGISSMQSQNNSMRMMYEHQIVPAQVVARLQQGSLKSFIALGEAVHLVDRPALLKQKMAEFDAYQRDVTALKKQFASMPMSASITTQYKNFTSTDADWQAAKKDILDAISHADAGAVDVLNMEARPLLMQRQDALSKLVEVHRADAESIYLSGEARFRQVRLVSLAALAFGLLLAMWMAILLVRTIVRTLSYAGHLAREIAQGKLGHGITVGRRDELGDLLDAFASMDDRLSAIVGEVRHGSSSVSTAAQQISRGNDDLSQRTQEQASHLEETASSMEEMTSTVKQNAENASQANQLARGARAQAERGGEVVAQAVIAMREISGSSRKIADIVSLIDEIAFQTNLLALNAAVEAARAGEQGRGFAVVATEVRNLAQRSASAAKEIKGLINDSADKVNVGSALVDQSGKALAEIVDSVKKVTDIVAEIAAASQEQSAGIDQVNHAVLQMDEMTQQNAALVEEAAAAARAMQEQASELTEQVGFFQLSSDAAVSKPAVLRADRVAAEAEAVFAAVRNKPAPRPAHAPAKSAIAAAGVWKEF